MATRADVFIILVITGAIIWGLGRIFWKARPNVTLLLIGAVQALMGLAVYLLQVV